MKVYSEDAVELCRKLFCKYGGKNHPAIEQEMRKEYPGWSKQNLIDRGKGKDVRLGWITRYGFEKSLQLYMQKLTQSVNDDEQDLYLGIKTVRQGLQEKVASGKCTRDELYQYRDFCKLEIEARRNLDLSRDNLETFVAGYEKLISWLSDIDKKVAAGVIKHGEKLAELAAAHYGKSEEVVDGASDREDESGD